ncbi:MAG: hypothetical protein ACI8WT_001243 [Clostridium sp.]|jgi:hypothetical protein
MNDDLVRILHKEKLKACIDALRDVLNEMCCAIDEPESNIQKLIVSCQLDELIVEYMSLKNNNYKDDIEVT